MRTSFLAGLVIGVLGLSVTAATAIAVPNVERNLGLVRGSVQIVDAHIDLTALHHGLLSWDSVYESPADPMAVWYSLPRLANMALEEGAHSGDICLILFQVEQFYGLGRTTTAKLCAASNGTRLYLNQRLQVRLRMKQ